MDVPIRDRLTVFAYALGGFLAAVIVTALHLYIAYLEGTGAHAPLYLLLMGGTMGVGAGTVAGVFDSKQRAATREARRQSDRLEEFVSVVSHDLRNPLSVARGRLDAAFRTGSADHLKEVDASLQRMDELIEASLSVARNGTQVEETYAVPLVELASDAWSATATGDATYEVVDSRTLQVDPAREATCSRIAFATRWTTDETMFTSASVPVTAASSSRTTVPASQRTNATRS